MDGQEKDLRIVREFAIQNIQKAGGVFRRVQGHGAAHPGKA
jgi:hypothetical protein